MPKGLRPIRTTSGRVTGVTSQDDNQLKGFAARLQWARQQCLRQSGNQQAAQPTPARVSCLDLLALSTFSFLPTCCYIYLPHVCLVLYLPVVTCLPDFVSTCGHTFACC